MNSTPLMGRSFAKGSRYISRFNDGTKTVRPHTTVDHRSGGPEIAFTASSAWIAIAEFDSKSDRQPAVIAATETRVELFAAERNVGTRFVMASRDGRRVVAMLWIAGHDMFRSLQSAWDQHGQHVARTDKATASTLSLSRCIATVGQPVFTTDGAEILTFETLDQRDAQTTMASLDANIDVLGAALLADEAGQRHHLLTRSERAIDPNRHFHLVRSWDPHDL